MVFYAFMYVSLLLNHVKHLEILVIILIIIITISVFLGVDDVLNEG